ncbi:Nucleoside diphosphate-linked moiety X motif 8 [Channa argus]|uniref:Nucleoside diphosphate-linked moiety X motif 8 n=2 Tax=Channa argus TaxID=215402 RepID=A0A6G1PS48_CHAAH|nr:Nucleoside diphosphate-linked moiety X motif 8 [Channa argus]
MEEVLTTVPCSSKLFLGSMYYDNHKMKEALFPYLQSKAILSSYRQPLQYVASAKARRASNPWKNSLVGDLGENTKAVSTYCDCLSNTTCLQPWRRPCQRSLSFTSKTLFNLFQNHLYCRRYCVRAFCSSTHMPRTLKHFHTRPQASSFSPQQTRRLHPAAPCAAAALRDCLSPENENRCRQSLRPNLKLYELEQEKKWTLSQGKNQGRCASVLVSLCSVGKEPAFLFTLRSSTLKGRHKGDVSFAGGKSDPSDRDVVATALREAREELGITVASERIWGVLKPLRDVSGMMIAPVLANIGALEDLTFKPNPGEVEEIFTLSLSHLCNPQNRGYTHFRVGDKYCYTLPVFRNGKHKVWGLTAVALDQTLKLIVPS